MSKYEMALIAAEALRAAHNTRDISIALEDIDGDFRIDFRQRADDGKIYMYHIDIGGGIMVNKFKETEAV